MNQILNIDYNTKNINNEISMKNQNKKFSLYKISLFKIQFLISIIFISIIILTYFYYKYALNNKEKISDTLVNNYNISNLYETSYLNTYSNNNIEFSVIGLIEIPKLTISYPILSNYNDELLKIAPCKISGPMPNEIGNLCIAGHNYDNYKFFSKISSLNNNDEIIIYDINGNKKTYFVFNVYEVANNDLSPLNNYENNVRQITLITCNNSNSHRIIAQAKENEL